MRVQRVVDQESGEVFLHCHSKARELKEQAMQDQYCQRFEQALEQLNAGLSKKNHTKAYDKVMVRIGRIKQKYSRAAQHYEIEVDQDEKSKKATEIRWIPSKKAQSQATHPGVYATVMMT